MGNIYKPGRIQKFDRWFKLKIKCIYIVINIKINDEDETSIHGFYNNYFGLKGNISYIPMDLPQIIVYIYCMSWQITN